MLDAVLNAEVTMGKGFLGSLRALNCWSAWAEGTP